MARQVFTNDVEDGRLSADADTALAPPSGVKPQEGLEQSRSSHGARFSPGPWFVEEMETRARQYRVRCTYGISTGGRGMTVVERIALDHDARLIAAAPDLYEAVVALLSERSRDGFVTARKMAHAALAKAQGLASGIEGEAGDPQGLHPEGESPVGEAETPNPPPESHP